METSTFSYTPLSQGSHFEEYVPDEADIEGDEEAEQLEGFFGTIDDISKAISQISIDVEQIKHNHSVILASVKNQEAKDENNTLMNDVKKLSKKVHAGLKRLKVEIEEEEGGQFRNTADFRIRKAQYATLSRKFRDVMGDYNQVQEDYRDKSKDRIQRQLKYTGKAVTEDQVEEMLESDNPAIFTQDILIDTAQKRQALNEVEARHVEIMQLEANIRELHEMFYDMALLVDEQGELIDRIEHNVESAAIHVDRGRKEVRTAVHFQKKNRKLKCCICLCCSSILAVILIAIAIAVGVAVSSN